MVDNFSKGRIGISFASGWHADDFVFAPDSYKTRREIMYRDIDIVRRLWQGEHRDGGRRRSYSADFANSPPRGVWDLKLCEQSCAE